MTKQKDDFATIIAVDLDPIKVKLMHKESGEGWSLEYASAVEFEYRRFLYLMKIFPREHAAPRFDVDIFWHYHILDTMKYAEDCEKVFGYFLHHFPYIGLRGSEDLATHELVGERMRELYEDTFGEPFGKPFGKPFGESFGESYVRAQCVQETAFSAATAQTAFSAAPVRTAFSAAAAQTAFSAAPVQTAFSARITPSALSGNAMTDEPEALPAPAAGNASLGMFTVRPVLTTVAA